MPGDVLRILQMLSHLSLTTRHEGEAIITHTSLGGNCAERLDVFPSYTTILGKSRSRTQVCLHP